MWLDDSVFYFVESADFGVGIRHKKGGFGVLCDWGLVGLYLICCRFEGFGGFNGYVVF